jgi:hypothetical protein
MGPDALSRISHDPGHPPQVTRPPSPSSPNRARPRGWGATLGTHVRYFAADLLAFSRSRLRSVKVYDRHRRPVGGTSDISVMPLR